MDKIFHHGKYYSEEEMNDIVRVYYEDVFSKKSNRHQQMQKLFPDDLSKSSIILDYGCGMGGVSHLFSTKYNCKIDGVEISENELAKALTLYGENQNINFMLLDEFTFPKKHYDLIFSSQVIEHVHNPGNYLSKINSMMKDDAYLLIGLPNIVNIHYMSNLAFFSQKKALKHSQNMLTNYNKASNHINGWEPSHFITLLASCGFELVEYLPTEGTPISMYLQKIPFIGKFIYKLPINTNLSYTMFFLVRKRFNADIGNDD